MFKKPPTLKPLTTIRSSARRSFISHLQALYPILSTVAPEVIQQVIPPGLKQCSAILSGGQRAVIYTDESGTPLWFELGSEAGAALQQSQKKQNQNGQPSKVKLAEVFPTVYALWIVPSLLPRLPTWPQIVEPTLVGGSALMIPGLIPPPHTYPEGQHDGATPPASSIVAITPYPSPVPMVVARSELNFKDLCDKRASGEKGKAATTIHSKGDCLWEMGGKKNPPSAEDISKLEQEQRAGQDMHRAVADGVQGVEEAVEVLALGSEARGEAMPSIAEQTNGSNASKDVVEDSYSVAEVDAIMHLALIQSLASISKQTDALPMPISSLYSAHVLPNRPAHWPPREAKGRKTGRLASSPLFFADQGHGEERPVNAESIDIKRTSAKKLSKWIKTAEKAELLRCKDVKGKDTVITWVNAAHADFQGLSPYQTLSKAQHEISSSTTNDKSGPATSVDSVKKVIVIERFWKASASSVKLFQEMGASTSEPLSQPVIRQHLYDYFSSRNLIDSRNQAQIRLDDPILVHALYPKAKLGDIPASLTRQEIIDRLQATSCVEYHRTSRLSVQKASRVQQINAKGMKSDNASNTDDGERQSAIEESEGEHIGAMTKGAAKAISVEIKTRQGRKVITLITGLEVYDIDPQALANDLMKLGASASASALPNSTSKNPKYEVFVQGDQRKAVIDYAESHGLDKRFVQVHDGSKKG